MHPLLNFLTLHPATICHESEVMRMQDCCTSVLCAAALLVLSFGIFALCIAGARYLERAKAPDAIDLGLRLSVPGKSFWLGLQGSKEKTDSKKGHPVSQDNGLLAKH